MSRFFSTLMIWVLAFMLPVQAIASAARISCGPDHHASSPVAGHPHPASASHAGGDDHGRHADRATHHAATAEDVHHAHRAHHVQHPKQTDSGALASSHASPDVQKYKSTSCSACAACCVGAAVLPAMPDWTPANSNSFVAVPSPPSAFSAHVPAGLERPPRLTFA